MVTTRGVIRSEKSKARTFLFEKKNQKTLVLFGWHRVSPFGPGAAGNLQKFFASFFQERSLFPAARPFGSCLIVIGIAQPVGAFSAQKPPQPDGQCGRAVATIWTHAPQVGLCASGTASPVTAGDAAAGPWSWHCSTPAGSTAYCSTPVNLAADRWLQYSGDYTRPGNHPNQFLASTKALKVSNGEDEFAQARQNVFQARRDLVIDQVVYRKFNLPTSSGDPATTSQGDNCLYARTQVPPHAPAGTPPVDPGPAELFCNASYATVPSPLIRQGPLLPGAAGGGLYQTVTYPSGIGLFVPKNTTLSCPSHFQLIFRRTSFTPTLTAPLWTCLVRYHVAGPDEVVGRIARVPYADAIVEPPNLGGTNLIDPDMAWLTGWKSSTGDRWTRDMKLTLSGFSLYAGVTGLNPKLQRNRTYENICLIIKHRAAGTIVQKACVADETYAASENVPRTAAGPVSEAFHILPMPIVLQPGDDLHVTCQSADTNGAGIDIPSDCTLFILYAVTPHQRIPSVSSYYWNLGQIDPHVLDPDGRYCHADNTTCTVPNPPRNSDRDVSSNLRLLTPAGQKAMCALLGANSPPWSSAPLNQCANLPEPQQQMSCACREFFQPFPGRQLP